jgi:sulfate permease, SulP family
VRERLPSDAAVDPALLLYDLEGELFFGAAPELDRYFEALKQRIQAQRIKFVVLRLKRVRNPDLVCIERLEHFLREENAHGVTALLAGVRPETAGVFNNTNLETWFPATQSFPEEDEQYLSTLKAVRLAVSKLRAARAADVEAPESEFPPPAVRRAYSAATLAPVSPKAPRYRAAGWRSFRVAGRPGNRRCRSVPGA